MTLGVMTIFVRMFHCTARSEACSITGAQQVFCITNCYFPRYVCVFSTQYFMQTVLLLVLYMRIEYI